MQIKWLSAILFFACMLMLVNACRHEIPAPPGSAVDPPPPEVCDPQKVYFRQQVLPILASNCAKSGCHDAASRQKGVELTSYERVMATADIRPGNPGGSKLYRMITETDPRDRMPPMPNQALTSAQIQLIYNWIFQGARDLVCQEACNTSNITYSGVVRNIIALRCQGCHGGATPQAGIDLSTYNGVKAKVNDGRLWGAINHEPGFSPMPKSGPKLSSCELGQVKTWIDAGAPNN